MDKKYSISTAFSLPAEEAIDYLKAKGYAITDNWQDLWQEAHDKAFSIAGVTNIDVLQDVRGMLEKSQKDGLSYGKFKEQLSDKLKARGWWGEKISVNPKTGTLLSVDLSKPHRLETIYRTNMQTSYNAGRYTQAKALEKLLPYWEYVAVLDARTRPDHSKLDGTILPADDPAWGTIHPPNGFNCRCTVLPRSQYWVDANGKQVSSSGTLPDLSKVPDNGWAYNPGASMWKPDLKKYDKDIAVLLDVTPNAVADASVVNQFSIEAFEKVGPQRGSNPGGTYRHIDTGELWYIKQMDDARARNEILAGKLYKALGVEVPDLEVVLFPDNQIGVASKIIEGLKANSTALKSKKIAGVAEGFGADVWLANWDVVGLEYDNLLTVGSGKKLRAIRVDTGGALSFRAQGSHKGSAFNASVTELETMLDANINSQSAAVFGNYSSEDLQKSLRKVARMPNKDIIRIVDEFGFGDAAEKKSLADLLIQRKTTIRNHLAKVKKQQAEISGVASKKTSRRSGFIIEGESEKIVESRNNGFSIISDTGSIEDQQILFWQTGTKQSGVFTNAHFKLRGDAIEKVDSIIKKGSQGSAPVSNLNDKILTAIKGISHRAKTGAAIEEKDLDRVAAVIAEFKSVKGKLLKMSKDGLYDSGVVEGYVAAYQPWIDALEAATANGAGSKAAWQAESMFSFYDIPTPKNHGGGIVWERRTGAFKASNIRRGHTNRTDETVYTFGEYYETNIDGVRIKYWNNKEHFALYGRVEAIVDGEAAASSEKVYKVLEKLGIDMTPPNELDLEELYLRKIAYFLNSELDNFAKAVDSVPDQAERVAAAKAFLNKKLSIEIDRLVDYNYNGTRQAFGHGRIVTTMPDVYGKSMRQFEKKYRVHHENTNSDFVGVVDSILNSGGQMAPTVDKLRRGIKPGGMSPERDLETGGADYFFTRIRSTERAYTQPGFVWNASSLRRLDAISYDHDAYGRTTGRHVRDNRKSGVDGWEAAAKRSTNETIFKGSLSIFDDLDRIVCSSDYEKQRVIQVFKSHGYDQWPDGRQLNTVVVVAE